MEKSSTSELVTNEILQQCTERNLVCPLFSGDWEGKKKSRKEHDWSLNSLN